MTVFLIILHVVACLVLVVVILLQAGRGSGVGGTTFGFGGGVQTLFGTRAGDFLTKATSVCAILFLMTCISLDVIEARKARSLIKGGQTAISKEDIAKIKEALEKLKVEAEKKKVEVKTEATDTAQETQAVSEVSNTTAEAN